MRTSRRIPRIHVVGFMRDLRPVLQLAHCLQLHFRRKRQPAYRRNAQPIHPFRNAPLARNAHNRKAQCKSPHSSTTISQTAATSVVTAAAAPILPPGHSTVRKFSVKTMRSPYLNAAHSPFTPSSCSSCSIPPPLPAASYRGALETSPPSISFHPRHPSPLHPSRIARPTRTFPC